MLWNADQAQTFHGPQILISLLFQLVAGMSMGRPEHVRSVTNGPVVLRRVDGHSMIFALCSFSLLPFSPTIIIVQSAGEEGPLGT